MYAITFAGRPFFALTDCALFWPDRRALLVADLHFEKASWFARHGQMLPPHDSAWTASRLLALAEQTGAREIWALGDSFHDAGGPDRLGGAARESLDALAGRARIVWIAGNHDRESALPGERRETAEVDGIILRHEACPENDAPEISGHFHPKLRLRTGVRTVSRPCFLHAGNRLILPAFGALTGGLDVTDAALQPILGAGGEALLATRSGLRRFAVAGPGGLAPAAAAHIRM